VRNRLRHLFRGSRINRDKREDSFARAVIAEAERRRRQHEADVEAARRKLGGVPCIQAGESPATVYLGVDWGKEEAFTVPERCSYCFSAPAAEAHYPYCSTSCSVLAEQDSRD